jgi:hypothetical protein
VVEKEKEPSKKSRYRRNQEELREGIRCLSDVDCV